LIAGRTELSLRSAISAVSAVERMRGAAAKLLAACEESAPESDCLAAALVVDAAEGALTASQTTRNQAESAHDAALELALRDGQ
jgi:hypothetical protein